jgi:transcriptional regulator of acetoin/glycerol metabolism
MEVLLDDVPAWLWQRFHDHAARIEAPHAFTPVVERWRRAHTLGAAADGAVPDDHLLRGPALREHSERAGALAAAATRTLDETQAFLAQRGYLLLLADPDGVVVSTRGGGAFADEARRVRLIEGACWSEAVRGTNAIGTALTEAQPTAVKGHAHYGRRFQNLVCYAAPICGPDGRVVGVLDATSSLERADDVVGFTVTAAARALEDALRQGAYASAGAAVARALTQAFERVRGPVLLIEPPGRIARANAAAHSLLGDAGGTRVQATLGLSFGVLLAEAADAAATGLALTVRGADGRPRTMRAFVDPIAAVDGSVIALVVYLEDRVGPAAARTLAPADPFAALFSADPAVDTALGFARTMAASTVPIMILAETGAGKELVASAIHRASPRRDGPFVAVNCGAIAPSLLESELFGYAPGAFSGAERAGRAGYLAEASGGTLFLDEVAEMPPAMQAALLRVLEDGTYRRVGEARPTHADVRIVTATCRDLPAAVAEGRFRQDLYYRLKGATVTLPALRARRDRVALAEHLVCELAARQGRRAPTLAPELAAWIETYPWPGNIRELKTVLDVALVLAGGAPALACAHLPPDLATTSTVAASPAVAPAVAAVPGRLDEVEAATVRQALAAAAGNVSAVAARLGVARSTVYRMMRRAGLRGDGDR